MKKRVADIITEMLYENGIKDCFLVVGGGAMHLDNAFSQNKNFNKYFNHHEQACAMAAEAYARYSGKMAAVCVTCGPGGTNTLTGVMGAWQDSLPLIVIAGQVRYETTIEKSGLKLRHRGLQEFNILDSVRNMTKYCDMIRDPRETKRIVQKAIDIAMSGRRGPVWIDVPLDIQGAVIEEEDLLPCDKKEVLPWDKKGVDEAVALLNNAERACVLAGSGIISSGNRELFHQAFTGSDIPLVGGAWVCDIHSMECSNYYGISGNIGPRTGNFILQNADVILVLGNSLAYRQTGFAQELFAPKAKIIMVDIDPNEPLKPGLHVEKFVHCDLKDFFEEIIREKINFKCKSEWVQYCQKLKERFTPFEALESGVEERERISSYYFWKVFQKYAKPDTILALGNNTANTAKLQVGINSEEQRALTNYTCGSMGYDLPAAIGAAVASGKEVICSTGDGSIMMNLQELQTIRYYDLPVKIIIFANDGYNAIRQTCKNFFKGEYFGCSKESGISFPEFSKIADCFGFEYILCETNAELDSCIQKFMNSGKRIIMEVAQKMDDPVIPKVTSRMDADGKFLTPALHDMAPFLDVAELQKLMF